ncbi:uncharacterized protein B0P05DRAFT_580682 [Gilbertella persicaria]|uniref:uncharacterized protein n=1 Tax=Gilbertella persicaria TaxID=101096 RepID=UPI00221F0238|nr:uncharacterized protein B0P05DRAFT_580682 [Gilbertella persicaria]KAI8068182.1 hypothetical protein B0P05DRAFT_580682 [Gilbertella persicaria]
MVFSSLCIFYYLIIFVKAQQGYYKNKVLTDASLGYGFTVDYFDTYKVLTNLMTNQRYALVCCNQSLSNFTSGYHAAVNTPLTSVSVDQALDVLPFFELLNITDKVKAVNPIQNVTSPCYAGISDSPHTTVDAVFSLSPGVGLPYISMSFDHQALTPLQVKQIMNSFFLGMTLIHSLNQSTTYQNLSLFHQAIEHVDVLIDNSDPANFKANFAYGDWLKAIGLTPNSNTFAFLIEQAVYRTDRLMNTDGFSDWPVRHAARADLVLSDMIHMVYNTYEPSMNRTWFRAFAQLEDTQFISNTTYPTCTNVIQRLDLDSCRYQPFQPNKTLDITPKKSTNPNISHGLSTGGKVYLSIEKDIYLKKVHLLK